MNASDRILAAAAGGISDILDVAAARIAALTGTAPEAVMLGILQGLLQQRFSAMPRALRLNLAELFIHDLSVGVTDPRPVCQHHRRKDIP